MIVGISESLTDMNKITSKELRGHIDKALRKMLDSEALTRKKDKEIFNRIKDLESTVKKNNRNEYQQFESLLNLKELINAPGSLIVSGLRGYALSPDALLVIARYIQENKPEVIVEYGSGVSTVLFAWLVKDYGGRIVSFDHEKKYAQETEARLNNYDLLKYVDLKIRPLKKHTSGALNGMQWYGLEKDDIPSKVDVVLVDGPPEKSENLARYPALASVSKSLHAGSRIYLDDSDRKDETEIVIKWLKDREDLRHVHHFTEKGLAEIIVQ